jgi:DNA-binding protein YbaB
MGAAVVKVGPTFIETSANSELMIELNAHGEVLRVQIEPEIWATWSAEVLADRIVRLHRAALMRARAKSLLAMNEQDAANLAPGRAWPAQREAEEFRRTIDF